MPHTLPPAWNRLREPTPVPPVGRRGDDHARQAGPHVGLSRALGLTIVAGAAIGAVLVWHPAGDAAASAPSRRVTATVALATPAAFQMPARPEPTPTPAVAPTPPPRPEEAASLPEQAVARVRIRYATAGLGAAAKAEALRRALVADGAEATTQPAADAPATVQYVYEQDHVLADRVARMVGRDATRAAPPAVPVPPGSIDVFIAAPTQTAERSLP